MSFLLVIVVMICSCEKETEIDNLNQSRIETNGDYSFLEDTPDSLNGIITRDGHIALFGVMQADSADQVGENYNRIIYVTNMDMNTNVISHEDDIFIWVDSLNMPSAITAGGITYLLTNHSDNTFDCVSIDNDGNMSTSSFQKAASPMKTRRSKKDFGDIASSPSIPTFDFNDFCNTIGNAEALWAMLNATGNGEKALATLSAIGSLMGGAPGVTVGLIGSATNALSAGLTSIAGYLWEMNHRFILKHLGPWYVGIHSVKQTDRHVK